VLRLLRPRAACNSSLRRFGIRMWKLGRGSGMPGLWPKQGRAEMVPNHIGIERIWYYPQNSPEPLQVETFR
jgi:hypothetical protein